MAIQYVGEGGKASGTAGVTVALPTGLAAGDLMLLCCETANEAVATPSGWTLAPNGDQAAIGTAGGTGATRMTVFYRIATASESAVSVADPGNHICAFIHAWRGVDAAAPIAATRVASGSSSISLAPTITSPVGGTVVFLMANDVDSNTSPFSSLIVNGYSQTPTNINGSTITGGVIADGATNAGNGGAYGLFARVLAGSLGDFSFSSIGSSGTVAAVWAGVLREPVKLTGTLTTKAGASATATLEPFSIETIGSATGVTRAVLPSYQAGDLIVGMAFRDGNATAPGVPSGWVTENSSATSNSSAVLVSKVATGSKSFSGLGEQVYVTMPSSKIWSYLASSPTQLAVLGSEGDIAYTTDGVNFSSSSTGLALTHYDIEYGGGVWIAVYSSGSTVLRSTNLINWTAISAPSETRLSAYFDGTRFLIGSTSQICRTDGTAALVSLQSATNVRDFSHSGTSHVAVSDAGYIYRSSDAFQSNITTAKSTSVALYSVVYGDGKYITAGGGIIFVSADDGVTWDESVVPVANGNRLFYKSGIFYIASSTEISWSRDGYKWTNPVTLPVSLTGGVPHIFDGTIYLQRSGSTILSAAIESSTEKFTNATSVAFNVYRGVDLLDPVGNATSASGTGTQATLPAVLLSQPARNPFTASFLGHQSTDVITEAFSLPSWEQQTRSDLGDWFVGSGGGKFILSRSGAAYFLTSTDGKNWTQTNHGVGTRTWRRFAYGNGIYVTVDRYGTGYAAKSSDALSWSEHSMGASNWVEDITFGNGAFVAVTSGSDYVLRSVDGINWTRPTIGSGSWTSVSYGSGIFVALQPASSVYATSPDGVTWTTRSLPFSTSWISVAYGSGLFLATSSEGSQYATSPDGINWTARTLPSVQTWAYVAHQNGMFLMISASGQSAYSFDGETWEMLSLPAASLWLGLAGVGRTFVATSANNSTVTATLTYAPVGLHRTSLAVDATDTIASYSSGGAVSQAESTIGQAWASGPSLPSSSASCRAFCMTGSEAVLVTNSSDAGGTIVMTRQQDGSWVNTTRISPAGIWQGNVANEGYGFRFMFVSGTNSYAYSNTGTSFTVLNNLPTTSSWADVCVGDGKYVAVGTGSIAATSPLVGLSWTSRAMPASRSWKRVCYGGPGFVAITDSISVTHAAYSADGITWQATTLPTARTWYGLCYGGGLYVATSASAKCATSPDGINWTERDMPFSATWSNVIYAGGVFVAVVESVASNQCAYSYDGITWFAADLPSSGSIAQLAFSGSEILAVVNNSTTLFRSVV